jgi:prophage regulatory protein
MIEDQRFIRLPEVIKITGLSRSSIYNMCYNGSFPKQFKLSSKGTTGAVAWCREEILMWMKNIRQAR